MYVPQFVAIIYAMKYAEEHNLFEPFTEAYPPMDTIQVKSYLNLETLANLTGTCMDELHFLNPALKTKSIAHRHQVAHHQNALTAKIFWQAIQFRF